MHRLLKRFVVTLAHVLMPNLKTHLNGTTRQPNLMMLPIIWKARVLVSKMEAKLQLYVA